MRIIFLTIILLFAIISSFYYNTKEGFEQIHTLGLDESKFTPSSCGNIIPFSGSLGCPILSEEHMNTLLSRGNNNKL